MATMTVFMRKRHEPKLIGYNVYERTGIAARKVASYRGDLALTEANLLLQLADGKCFKEPVYITC